MQFKLSSHIVVMLFTMCNLIGCPGISGQVLQSLTISNKGLMRVSKSDLASEDCSELTRREMFSVRKLDVQQTKENFATG